MPDPSPVVQAEAAGAQCPHVVDEPGGTIYCSLPSGHTGAHSFQAATCALTDLVNLKAAGLIPNADNDHALAAWQRARAVVDSPHQTASTESSRT